MPEIEVDGGQRSVAIGLLELRVLGPLEVRGPDGQPLALGGRKQRALLARLLLEGGRTVAVDQLLADLWEGEPPSSAVKIIHVCVSQLRKVLPAGLLVTAAPGYALRPPDPEAVDLVRAERLRTAGRAALQRGDEAASELLREALSLWRGPALAEFSEPFAEHAGPRLEELRLACLEDRVEADLRRGEHGELVAELETLVAANPLRERPRGQLMLALYRAGRQAEALAVYHDFRRTLDDELGIEPSARLRELEVAMLRQEAGLAAPSPPTATAAPAAPAAHAPPAPTPPPAAPAAPQRAVHYVRSGDVSVAFQVVGDGPLDIVLVHGWVCSFHPGWERAQIAHFYERLARMGRLILFDKRGTGLSDRVTGIAPLEQRMDDLRAVLDAVRSERAAVLGVSEGGPMSALYAATFPERTAALVVMGAFARRRPGPDYPIDIPQLQIPPEEWGSVAAARAFVAERAPSVVHDEEAIRWYASYLMRGGSPGAAAHITQMNLEIDIRHVLPIIHVPTLVLYRAQEYLREATRYMGERIPGARMEELPGADHLPWEGDQDRLLDHIEGFLADVEAEVEPDRVLATVLHVRVPESRRPLLRGHLGRHRGTEIPGDRDALRATFDGPARAIRCAWSILSHAAAIRAEASAGLHTGECELGGPDVRGLPVTLADGIARVASTGEVLVSSTVRDLVAGSGMAFSGRGPVELPVAVEPRRWELFAAEEVAATARLPAG